MTPDARLSAAERAALADLEAAATASDPLLAARLRGSPVIRLRHLLPLALSLLQALWGVLLRARGRGLLVVAVGLFSMILGLSTGFGLSAAGAVMALLGLRMLAELLVARPGGRPGSSA